ncbi:hypothetical protein SAMN05216525_12984 [Bradyrhizobium sp. Gha]|nr:hypothetical protein SAMN05216525_12984 [Bradyrhizobium sp. Gha]
MHDPEARRWADSPLRSGQVGADRQATVVSSSSEARPSPDGSLPRGSPCPKFNLGCAQLDTEPCRLDRCLEPGRGLSATRRSSTFGLASPRPLVARPFLRKLNGSERFRLWHGLSSPPVQQRESRVAIMRSEREAVLACCRIAPREVANVRRRHLYVAQHRPRKMTSDESWPVPSRGRCGVDESMLNFRQSP